MASRETSPCTEPRELRNRFRAALLAPLVFAAGATGCGDGPEQREVCAPTTEQCPTPARATDLVLGQLDCSQEELLSVDSYGRYSSTKCCYDVTVTEGDSCSMPIPGRPLRNEEQWVVSEPMPTPGWLPPADRGSPQPHRASPNQKLTEFWTHAGLCEHASIASFQRHALDLLAFGAPAALVQRATEAALDEVRHAELCFEQATTYSGRPVGPGPLPLQPSHLSLSTNLETLALSVLLDGCVNETLAAVEAARRGQAARRDSRAATIFATLASDEAAHAELAWRTLAWACAQLTPDAITRLGMSLSEYCKTQQGQQETSGERALTPEEREGGLLSRAERKQLAQDTLLTVILPCFEELRRTLVAPTNPKHCPTDTATA